MKINTLLRKARIPIVFNNHDVYKLTTDSRLCVDNSIFIAIESGEKYIEDAIKKGAKTIIVKERQREHNEINYIYVENPRKILAILAKEYYHKVSEKIKLIGVIGTNGKTSTSTIAYNFFESVSKRSMLIGSNGVIFKGYEASTNNTTPDILTIYQYLSMARKKKIGYVFIEVSSIAVDQYRVFGLDFDVLIFTNFSQDHLDYHHTLENYFYCKVIPFIMLKKEGYAIINLDDEKANSIARFTSGKVITYGFNSMANYIGAINEVNENGSSFYSKNLLFKTKLLGEFNLYNCLAVLPLCDIFNISYLCYSSFLTKFKNVKGRMNLIKVNNRNILIDYAHTFIATKKSIEEALKISKKKLYVLLGCGGNREKEKRGMIGKYLNSVNANVILTTDNPRYEKPIDIISDIKKEMNRDVTVIVDRKEAIKYALNNLQDNDSLLILGKGCEKYIEVMGVKHPYSDLEEINAWIRNH